MKRERTIISFISLVAMIVVMLSTGSVSAFEIKGGHVYLDAGEHVDFGLQCPENRDAYIAEVQAKINRSFSKKFLEENGIILPEEPELDASDSVFDTIAAMTDYLNALPVRFYARSHSVSNEGLTGFALYKSIVNPELYHTIAIENQSGATVKLRISLFSSKTVKVQELKAVSGIVFDLPPYVPSSDPLFYAEGR